MTIELSNDSHVKLSVSSSTFNELVDASKKTNVLILIHYKNEVFLLSYLYKLFLVYKFLGVVKKFNYIC